jgi:hypothetical protein
MFPCPASRLCPDYGEPVSLVGQIAETLAPFLFVPALFGIVALIEDPPLFSRPEWTMRSWRFRVWTRTTLGDEGAYLTSVRGRTMQDAWVQLLRDHNRPDPHQVIDMRMTGPVEWPSNGRSPLLPPPRTVREYLRLATTTRPL